MYARKTPSHETAAPAVSAPAPQPSVGAQHDTPGHIGGGDGVAGESVEVNGVVFTPGEVNALVDYVGPPSNLYEFTTEELRRIQALLRSGETDAAVWDDATHGLYSELAQANGDHFAPGPGADFEESFVAYFSAAIAQAKAAQAGDDEEAAMNQARLWAYSAEHYLEDAFAGGHQVSAGDIEAAVDAALAGIDDCGAVLYPLIGASVWEGGSEIISQYEYNRLGQWNAIDTFAEWEPIAIGAGLYKGREGMTDAVRKHVHEALGERGVEVASPAHPTPWVLPCDEGLAAGESPETEAAMAAALTEVRDALALQVTPSTDPEALARAVFTRHRPVPTANGQALVDETLRAATADAGSLADAVSSGLLATLPEVMSTLVAMSRGLVRKRAPGFGGAVGDVFSVPEIAGAPPVG